MKQILFASALILCIGTHAYAAPRTFQWTASPSTDAAGYRLYSKDVATGNLTKLGSDIPGRETQTATVEVAEPVGTGQFWVVAKAYDAVGNESTESNRAYTTDPDVPFVWRDVTPPEPPTTLQVLQQIANALDRIASALER